MIGFYNYTVILTYVSLLSSTLGIFMSIKGNFLFAVFCLIISGICDMFDGMVARSHKNRSDLAKAFGIQIDSLCDLVCFGVFPAIFNVLYTDRHCSRFTPIAFVISAFFILCAVIRLGYFNVMEVERQKETQEVRKYYQGMPVTTISGYLPLSFTLRNMIGHHVYFIILNIIVLVVAILFVLDIKIPKPHKKGVLILTGLAFLVIVVLALQGLKIIKF